MVADTKGGVVVFRGYLLDRFTVAKVPGSQENKERDHDVG